MFDSFMWLLIAFLADLFYLFGAWLPAAGQ